jgi:nitroreductase
LSSDRTIGRGTIIPAVRTTMDVLEAVASRYSCRDFLSDPVPEQIVRDVLTLAARAPSAGNMQPWFVYVLTGKRLSALKEHMATRSAELPIGEGTDYQIYPTPLGEPYRSRRFKVGEMLYESLGVKRENKAGRYAQYAKNFQLFGAPVGLFFVREKAHGVAQWADIGGFLQTVAIVARHYNLHTCPQQAWVSFHKTIRSFLDIPDHLMLYSGMAMGYANDSAAINAWRAPRADLEDFTKFEGFER